MPRKKRPARERKKRRAETTSAANKRYREAQVRRGYVERRMWVPVDRLDDLQTILDHWREKHDG